jgi:probable HAF family extracellular repeat protein
MRALPTLGGDHASARWINNAGQIIGTSTIDPNSLQYHGVTWENEQIYRLPPLIGFNLPIYIHDNGDIAGSATVEVPGIGPKQRAVIWRDREIVLQLGTLADGTPFEPIASSHAHGVNASGVIVGMSTNATGDAVVPFIYRDGEMVQLDDLMPEPWMAYDVGPGSINDAGQIAVHGGIPGSPPTRALLLTPIAQPLPGDLDGDGDVDLSDLASLLAVYNSCAGDPTYDPAADLDSSGCVDLADLATLLANYGG